MTAQNIRASLRLTDRKRLLAHLTGLGASDPERRARAALEAAELLRQKGLSWQALMSGGLEGENADDQPPTDWRAQATALLTHPGLTEAECKFLRKILAWRAPGADGWARLQEIAARVGSKILPKGV